MLKRYQSDIFLVGAVVIVAVAGIFTLYTQELIQEDPEGRWFKQLIFFVIGLFLCFFMRRLNFQVLGGGALIIYGISIFLLLITLIPFIGSEIKGARSWIRLGPLGLQTSEVAKLSTILFLAKYLEIKEREMDRIPSLLIAFSIVLLPMLLIVIQPDFGGAFSIAPILLAMLFLAGADVYHITSVLIFFIVALLIPLYIEYHNITLIEPLISQLSELGKTDILPAARILRFDIWGFVEKGVIPDSIQGADRAYLAGIVNNSSIMDSLRESATSIRYEYGGLLLRILDNDVLLISVGVILSLTAAVLFVLRVTQGKGFANLRRFYIPLGVLGISLLSAATVHLTFSFKYHQVVRVTAFVNPEKFPRDLAYQIRASKAAIGSGEFFGRGMFQGDMTIGDRPLVPEAYTDFIFTSWAERTGFLGAVLLIFVLAYIPIRALQIGFDSRDRFGSILAGGIGFMYFFHMALNIGITLGLLPVTGLPLSFMSYGGSHMIVCMMALGILLSINRRKFAN